MTGIDRSKLSCRTLLFLFVLIGAPIAARCDTLEDSARELAKKIVATLPIQDPANLSARSEVILEFQNLSSLSSDDFARAIEALKAGSLALAVGTSTSGTEVPRVRVTLSENLTSYVWTAVVRRGDTFQTVFSTMPLPVTNQVLTDTMRMTLHSEKIWEGQEQILDVTFVFLPDFEQRMVLLVPDGIIITKAEKGAALQKVEFPPPEPLGRGVTGAVNQLGNLVESVSGGRTCDVSLDTQKLIRCYVPKNVFGPDDHGRVAEVGGDKPIYGDEVRDLPNDCSTSGPILASGTGDYTRSDTAQVFMGKSVISNQVSFPGPVLKFSLGPDPQFVTAIVRDLKDGNYEVYRLSISCGQ